MLLELGLGPSLRITYSTPAGARGRLQPGPITGKEEWRKPCSRWFSDVVLKNGRHRYFFYPGTGSPHTLPITLTS